MPRFFEFNCYFFKLVKKSPFCYILSCHHQLVQNSKQSINQLGPNTLWTILYIVGYGKRLIQKNHSIFLVNYIAVGKQENWIVLLSSQTQCNMFFFGKKSKILIFEMQSSPIYVNTSKLVNDVLLMYTYSAFC